MMIDRKNGNIRTKIRVLSAIIGLIAGIFNMYYTSHNNIISGSSTILTVFMTLIFPYICSEIFIHIMRWQINSKPKTLLIESLSNAKIINYTFKETVFDTYIGVDNKKITRVLFELENGNNLWIDLYFWNDGTIFGMEDFPHDVKIDDASIDTISEQLITEDSLVYFIDTVIHPKCLKIENEKNKEKMRQKTILLNKEKEDKKKEIEGILLNSKVLTVSKANPTEVLIEMSLEEMNESVEINEQNDELAKLMKIH